MINEHELGILANVNEIEIKKIENKTVSDYRKEFGRLLKSLTFKNVEIEEIRITNNKEFIENQHIILGNTDIAVDIEDNNTIRVVTDHPKAFIIDTHNIDERVYSILFTVHKPMKICINSKNIYRKSNYINNSIYDVGHISKIIYGKKINNLMDVISLFTKNPQDDDYSLLLYNLLYIKKLLSTLIEKNRLPSLFAKEAKIIEIMSRAEVLGMPFNKEKYDAYIKTVKEKHIELDKGFKERFKEGFSNKKELMKIFNKNGLMRTANAKIWETQNETDIAALLISKKIIEKHTKSELVLNEHQRLKINYDTYDEYGNITAGFEPDGHYITTDNVIVTGFFPHLYLRIFCSLSKLEELIDNINNNTFEAYLAKKLFGSDNPLARFNSIAILTGQIQGNNTPNKLSAYFYEKYDSYIGEKDCSMLIEMFNENCKSIANFIKTFKLEISKAKRISHEHNTSNLHRYIKLTEADIVKHSLILIDEAISDYRNRSSYKINLIGVIKNRFILEAEKEAANIAIDILNRCLTKSFSCYLGNVKALSHVNASHKLKNDKIKG